MPLSQLSKPSLKPALPDQPAHPIELTGLSADLSASIHCRSSHNVAMLTGALMIGRRPTTTKSNSSPLSSILSAQQHPFFAFFLVAFFFAGATAVTAVGAGAVGF